MIELIEQHHLQIESLCQRYHVKRLELFGSAVRGNFNPTTSDLDFFVEFEALGWKGSSNRYFGLLHGLEDLFNSHVDLIELTAVKNPHFIKAATQHRQLLYAA
jgi:hypothetical protein